MRTLLLKIMAGCLVFLITIFNVFGQEVSERKTWNYALALRYNFGALSPTSLPENVRAINKWSPGFSPTIGYEISYAFSQKWAIGTGLFMDFKSMKIEDSVIYMHTVISMKSEGKTADFEGDFSGTNNTIARNMYLSVPLSLSFQPGMKWRFSAGIYIAWLLHGQFYGTVTNGYIRQGGPLGEKVLIDQANFDFSEKQRTFDWGAQLFINRMITKRLSASAGIQWGLQPVFNPGFKGIGFQMYNLYGSLGLGWKIR